MFGLSYKDRVSTCLEQYFNLRILAKKKWHEFQFKMPDYLFFSGFLRGNTFDKSQWKNRIDFNWYTESPTFSFNQLCDSAKKSDKDESAAALMVALAAINLIKFKEDIFKKNLEEIYSAYDDEADVAPLFRYAAEQEGLTIQHIREFITIQTLNVMDFLHRTNLNVSEIKDSLSAILKGHNLLELEAYISSNTTCDVMGLPLEEKRFWLNRVRAVQGNQQSMFYLGEAYKVGNGVAADSICAYVWFYNASQIHSELEGERWIKSDDFNWHVGAMTGREYAPIQVSDADWGDDNSRDEGFPLRDKLAFYSVKRMATTEKEMSSQDFEKAKILAEELEREIRNNLERSPVYGTNWLEKNYFYTAEEEEKNLQNYLDVYTTREAAEEFEKYLHPSYRDLVSRN